ncbi:MAG TPA: preprotein translocase subunit SecG [Anaerolineales bacterium]|nr:preprotein translocase subunit SecG [Anaerolineales bacterium]
MFFNLLIIILSIALIVAIVFQSKGAGLGGLTGVNEGGVFRQRRGVEQLLFQITIVLSIVFFVTIILMIRLS